MAKTEKSKAELYRQERKDRIADAAKKNAKKRNRHPNAGKIIGRVIGIVMVVAIVAGAAFGILKSAGVFARMQTAFTVGEERVSVAEYGYMYYNQYQKLIENVQSYESQYGYNPYGFDYTKSPEEQEYPVAKEDGTKQTWADYLADETVSFMQEFYVMYNSAIAAGYETTEEDIADIEENLESMREAAATYGGTGEGALQLSLNSFLKIYYGEGITANFIRNLMEKQFIVQRFSADKQKEIEDKYTDEAIDKEYNEDPSKYNAVDLRLYEFKNETLTANAGETEDALKARQEATNEAQTAKAKEFISKVTDEDSFNELVEKYIHENDEETAEKAEEEHNHDSETKNYGILKQNITSYISEDAANWAFDAARKAGDKTVFTTDSASYAVYLVKPSYAQETVDVRHILFMTVDSSTGAALDDEKKAEKKALAEEVLAKWNASDKTEAYFAELATQYTEDPGSTETGGLYEDVASGKMVSSFDAWIFDETREVGDVEIIESELGYHLMYFVGNKDFSYRSTIRTTNTQNDYSSWLEAELEKEYVAVKKNESNMKKSYKRASKLIDTTVDSINAGY